MRRVLATTATAVWAAALGILTPACLEGPGFECAASSECIVNDVMGMCNLGTAQCEYEAPQCPSGVQDGAGACIDGSAPATSSTTTTTTGASADSDPTFDPTSTSSSTTDDTADDSSSGGDSTTTGDTSATTTSGLPCDGASQNITAFGVVGASTVFDGYPPGLSVDGDLATSWFSTGPEGTDVPSVYTWTLGSPRCINRLFISGNGLNSNQAFRQDFGFATVNFRVLDTANDVLFEESRSLDGSPDPDVSVDVPGVMGNRVVLEFTGHESDDCGGFSELQVLGGEL